MPSENGKMSVAHAEELSGGVEATLKTAARKVLEDKYADGVSAGTREGLHLAIVLLSPYLSKLDLTAKLMLATGLDAIQAAIDENTKR